MTDKEICGSLSEKCAVHIIVNGVFICRINQEELEEFDSLWTFKRSWLDKEIDVGITLIQVFADLSNDGSKRKYHDSFLLSKLNLLVEISN